MTKKKMITVRENIYFPFEYTKLPDLIKELRLLIKEKGPDAYFNIQPADHYGDTQFIICWERPETPDEASARLQKENVKRPLYIL